MAKVTSKLQLTLPKAVAEDHGIRPGDELDVLSAGHGIRLVPTRAHRAADVALRLRLFDQATRRQRRRQKGVAASRRGNRGWTREELYERGRAR
jgi:AbrB family looped-hinge helix DNA binding protein